MVGEYNIAFSWYCTLDTETCFPRQCMASEPFLRKMGVHYTNWVQNEYYLLSQFDLACSKYLQLNKATQCNIGSLSSAMRFSLGSEWHPIPDILKDPEEHPGLW